jgi:hypothetical protein
MVEPDHGILRPVIANTTFYAEFNSTGELFPSRYIIIFLGLIGLLVAGPGGNTSQRVPIEHKLTAAQVQSLDLTIDGVFLEHPKWIDFEYLF